MTKYICGICNKDNIRNKYFSQLEYNITNDKKRCILHCKKDNWYDIADKNTKKFLECSKKLSPQLNYNLRT